MTAEQLTIRADPVYKYCLNWVTNDEKVQKAIGDGITSGALRSYRLDSGKLIMKGKTPVWKPPRIQVSTKCFPCFGRRKCHLPAESSNSQPLLTFTLPARLIFIFFCYRV